MPEALARAEGAAQWIPRMVHPAPRQLAIAAVLLCWPIVRSMRRGVARRLLQDLITPGARRDSVAVDAKSPSTPAM